LSARAGEESRVEGLEAGADDYLVKPFSAKELLARVGAHLEMARMRREAEATLRVSEEALHQSEQRLAMELADMQQLQHISTQLLQEDDVDALYRKILDAAMAVMRSAMASMQMLTPDRGELRLLAWQGFHPTSAAFWEWVPVDSCSACAMALRSGQRVIVPDVETCDFMAGTDDLEA